MVVGSSAVKPQTKIKRRDFRLGCRVLVDSHAVDEKKAQGKLHTRRKELMKGNGLQIHSLLSY